jgi:hypothetical protein
MVSWTETKMVINADFIHPEKVSESYPDKFKVILINPGLFISKTGQTMQTGANHMSAPIYGIIPKQLPKGVKQKNIENTGHSVETLMNTIMIIQIIS